MNSFFSNFHLLRKQFQVTMLQRKLFTAALILHIVQVIMAVEINYGCKMFCSADP
jgi:hypothetical protein